MSYILISGGQTYVSWESHASRERAISTQDGINQYRVYRDHKHGKLATSLFCPTLWPEENAHSSLGELVQDLVPRADSSRNEDVEFDDSDDEGERERERMG